MNDREARGIRQVRRIVEEALNQEEPVSDEQLLERCGGNPDQAKEVRVLLDRVLAAQDGPPEPDHARGFLRGLLYPVEQAREVGVLLQQLVADSGSSASRRYVLGNRIGQGGMGVVHTAADILLHREVAIKTLRAQENAEETGVDGRLLGRFLDEAQITAQLDHPGVVPVHDIGINAEGRIFYSMPVVQGVGLDEAIRRSRGGAAEWSRTRVLSDVFKACQAVAFAHSKGVLHRDIKPANIMVGEYGQVYVMDWGLASLGAGDDARVESDFRSLEEPESSLYTRGGSVLGTAGFMSPEQARGEHGELDERTDVYSMGAVLFTLLTGAAPVEGEADLSSCGEPAELVAICERALAPDRNARYESMLALAGDLQAYLEGRVVRAHRTGVLAELSKWVQRNRGWAASIVLGVSVLLAGAVVWSRVQREGIYSDYSDLPVLVEEADLLGPAFEKDIPAMAEWIESAERLESRREVHARRQSSSDPVLAARAASFLEELDSFMAPSGPLAQVRKRMEAADDIEERTISGPSARSAWQRAITSIADEGESPLYLGLRIEPQRGLLPIGQDSDSGLWEFDALLTGEDTPIVLVLLPGGSFRMGSQKDDPSGKNYDENLDQDEEPAREVELSPFFIAKYETTQAQWIHMTGRNPSSLHPGARAFREFGEEGSLLHPVGGLSWDACERTLGNYGLTLPTEAQWEYASRGGAATRWGFDSDEPEGLAEAANVQDMYRREEHVVLRWVVGSWSDGYQLTAPVGSMRPNAFGLHDMLGNLWELCRDAYRFDLPPNPGKDPVVSDPSISERVLRGGAYHTPPYYARCSERQGAPRSSVSSAWGVRAAREIDPRAAR